MTLQEQIRDLAQLYGIESGASTENQVYLLQAMGVLPRQFDSNSEEHFFQNAKLVCEIYNAQRDDEYLNVVHQVSVMRKNRKEELLISLPEGVDNLEWSLQYEQGQKYSDVMPVGMLEPYRDHNGQEVSRNINGINYKKYRFKFPFDVDLGYHNVEFSFTNPADGRRIVHNSRLISAPERCYDGLGIKDGKKTWGVPVQLYEQVSENNLGIGNFSDLAQLGHILGKNGAGILGVNPLHAMRDDQPENASPYGPDSRMFFNYLYLDVTAIDEFKNNPDIKAYYHSPEFQEKIKLNRRRKFVDYETSQNLVDDILWRCYDSFISNKKTEEYKRFCVYCDDPARKEDLERYATFRALCRMMAKQDPAPVNWRQWPREYRDSRSNTVKDFQRQNRNQINFYKYSQWQCERQLAQVQEACRSSGMKIGLYTDNSVGCSCNGYEAWGYPDLYLRASAGAPPDVLSQNGQNWGVLGFNPIQLRANGYEPYRRILETNMKYAGCTRIDHVLQLQRLYMIPLGKQEKEGAFIHYNTDELMAIVALESHRNKTMVIGEDLGLIPDGFRPKLEDFGILSYRVLPFEREWGYKTGYGTNAMRHPHEYPQNSVCATSTHDTLPLVGQWNVQDIYLQHKLGMITDQQANDKFEQYATQREALNYALEEKGCWARVGGRVSTAPRQDAEKIPDKYIQAVMDYLGQSNSAVMLVPFSDIFGMKEMGNIPGVQEMPMNKHNSLVYMHEGKAYPSWRKKMVIPVEHIDKAPIFKEVTSIINRYRPDGNDGKGHYFEFHRMGEQKESVIDFERYHRLYDKLNEKPQFSQENIIRARYADKYRAYLERRELKAKNTFNQQRDAYNEYKHRQRDELLRQKAAQDR